MGDDLKLPKLPEGWAWSASVEYRSNDPHLILELRSGGLVHSFIEVRNPTKPAIRKLAERLMTCAGEQMDKALYYQMFKEML